jgi:hypothetical protein
MLRLNGSQLLAAVTLLIFLLMLAERLYVISQSEIVIAINTSGHPESATLVYTIDGKTNYFHPNEFTFTNLRYHEPEEVYIDPLGIRKPFIRSFSGIFGERIFYFCIITFAWLLMGSAILAKNEELLIGKGWLRAKKTNTGTPPETSRLPAVRKKSRNFKND